MKPTPKTYLGDSVYVEVEHGDLKLTSETGMGSNNVIYLSKPVFEAQVAFVSGLVDKPPKPIFSQ